MDQIRLKIKSLVPDDKKEIVDKIFLEAQTAEAKRIKELESKVENLTKQNEELRKNCPGLLENFKATVSRTAEVSKQKIKNLGAKFDGEHRSEREIEKLKEENEKLQEELKEIKKELENLKKR